MNVEQLLSEAAKQCTPPNFSGLAETLGVQPSAISNWRKGRALPDAVSSAKLADMLGLPLARVLGLIGEARAISREEKAVWRRLGTAAAVVLAVALPYRADASTLGATAEQTHAGCIMRSVVAFIRRMFGLPHGTAPVLA